MNNDFVQKVPLELPIVESSRVVLLPNLSLAIGPFPRQQSWPRPPQIRERWATLSLDASSFACGDS